MNGGVGGSINVGGIIEGNKGVSGRINVINGGIGGDIYINGDVDQGINVISNIYSEN